MYPDGPSTGVLNPPTPGGAASGATVDQKLRAEPGDEVDSADRRPRLSDRGDSADGVRSVDCRDEIELEIGMGPSPEREDPGI